MDLKACTLAPATWERKTIESVCTRVTSGGTPSRSNPDYYNGNIPWIKTKELEDGWIYNTEESINEKSVIESSAKILAPNAILMAMYGATVGQLGILGVPATCNQACCVCEVDDKIADFKYLYYQLLWHRLQIKSLSTGAAQQNLNAAQIKGFRLPFPRLEEQRQIGAVLSYLDDKIELNRKICQTLEEIARTLFQSWFVNFDPVRAKVAANREGRDPERAALCALSGKTDDELDTLPAETLASLTEIASFFPDQLIDSELGEIPEGWSITSLYQLASLNTSSISPASTPDALFEHYSIPAFDANNLPVTEYGRNIKSNKFRVHQSSVLVSKLNPINPRIWLPDVRSANAICSTEFMQFIPLLPEIRSFLYLLMKSPAMLERVLSRVTGSTGSRQRAQPSQIAELPVLSPHHTLVFRFCSISDSMLDKVATLRRESKLLSQCRDTLLPKLLSGEIPVSGASEEYTYAGS